MTITRILKTIEPMNSAVPTTERTITLPRGTSTGDVYRDGCALHHALAGKNRLFSGVVKAIRREISRLGDGVFLTEHDMDSWCGMPAGRADVVVRGFKTTGVVEMKIVSHLPDSPRPRDAAQLGGYTALVAHWPQQLSRTWAALIYVDLRTAEMKIYEFRGRELRSLVREAETALAA